MSHTLLLRLAGPMQSWGVSSRFSERDSGLEPSKSGVVGILSAALGRSRDADVNDLANLRMGVRADKEGVLAYDFHTAGAGKGQRGIIRANAKGFNVSVSRRFYLQDAIFLVGLEGEDIDFLTQLDAALRAPVHPLGLGRRSHVPSCPVAMPGHVGDGVRHDTPLEAALRDESWQVDDLAGWQINRLERVGGRLRVIVEDVSGSSVRPDQPVGAAFLTRVFGPRVVKTASVPRPLASVHSGKESEDDDQS